MKPALYYAIRKNWGNMIIAVTSEKSRYLGTIPDRWHGREMPNNVATHGRHTDLRGRFETYEAAEAMRVKIAAIGKRYDDERAVLMKQVSALHTEETREIEQLIRDNAA